jgi:Rrf2 family transcriptional regulator, iron-sulfur cluster assembly transcription factor
MFARSSGYAVQALTHLAGQPSGKLVGAREMATTLNILMPFLWKILRKLGQRKLVRSFKGVRGGYELARPAKTIHVSEILMAGRDTGQVGRCILGLAQCSDQEPCPLHSQWKDVRAQMEATLETTTLADLASSAKQARRKRSHRRHAPAKASSLS